MRVGIIGGSIAGCATAALLHRAGHDVTVFERSESDLVSRGAGIGTPTAVWQDMVAGGLLHESDLRADPLDGCDLLRVGYQGGHGVLYYIPGSGPSAEPGKRLLKWGYNLQVPEDALPSVLVDDQARQQSSSVPFGKVHPQVRACLESRLADLLPPLLFELVRQSSKSAIQAIYSVVPRSYARDRLCLVGDAGAVFPPFTSSGVLKAVANATSLADALAGAPAVDDALRRWSQD